MTISRQPRETEPGQTADTFSKAMQEQYMREYRAKYPVGRATADGMRPQGDERYLPPRGYSDELDHHRNFISAVKSRKPVIEDATFGFRAAGPALLSNISYFDAAGLHVGSGDDDAEGVISPPFATPRGSRGEVCFPAVRGSRLRVARGRR